MTGKKKVLVGVGVALASFGLLALLAVNKVTPVSEAEVIRRFHEERQEIGHRPREKPAGPTRAPSSRSNRSQQRPASRAGSSEPVNSAVPALPGEEPRTVAPPSPRKGDGGAPAVEGWPSMPVVVRPAEGVYTYRTDGHEGFEGIFDREFPPLSYRTIIHTGASTWSDHTIFSEERESWNSFEFSEGQRRVRSQRNRIEFATYERDETVTFTPPILTTVYPWKLGRTWRGTFSGETYGSFQARTVLREFMTVGGEQVHAWADRLDVELHGRIEGEVTATRWLSPEYGLTLREEYRADAWAGPIHYIAEWSVTLRSLRPAH